ncbi:amino acid decarboxylase [Streptomyces sp. NRRL S-920]|uniref:amino acid decarboxylase n=1 Tax=Streptomyces sp. NRRL S-920 TaxID=1463921 RepID=UPI0004C7120A|nr:amino acid decarboxylase [Streptomyces sp. NRRL S-920]
MAVSRAEVSAGLPALPDPATDSVLASGLVEELSYAFGGPFHFLLPDAFDANLRAMRGALEDAGVAGFVYYAKKANKAAVWIERCAAQGAGVDVASLGELREALGHGVPGEHLVVTGPAKAHDLLRLAVRQGALIAVDALDELDALLSLVADEGAGPATRPARVLLRALPPGQSHSRFGLTEAELATAMDRCAHAGETVLRMEGFSFHLSGYDVAARAEFAASLAELCVKARALGLHADRVSIGGGLPISYVGADDWRAFLAARHDGHFHARKSFEDGDFYPYHSPVAGADALRALLAHRTGGRALASVLQDAGVRLLLEPGRALLDRAGGTVFRVQGVKERAGYRLLTVDGSSLSLSEQWFASEYLPDPVLVPRGGAEETGGTADPAATEGTYPSSVGAATCLESDMVTWRKVPFRRRPRVGDLLVYPNTAGYQMDSNESPFHDLPLPPKVVVDRTELPRPRWRLDRHFT